MIARHPVSCSKTFSIAILAILLLLSFYASNLTLSVVRPADGTRIFSVSEEKRSGGTSAPHSYRPHCASFIDKDQNALYPTSFPDVVSYESDIARDDRERILAGDFPSTRFTPHVESLLKVIDLENMEDSCRWNFYFTVDEVYSTPSRIFCTGTKRSRQVPWWCKVFNDLFDVKINHPFPPILPSNVSLAISTDDFNDVEKEGYTCLANSSPQAVFTITNFLELQRMADQTTYPTLNWTERCSTPIWRGSAWREPGGIISKDDSMVLEQVLQKSTRLQAVIFSRENPELLDASISDPQNGFMKDKHLWARNQTNGLHKLLPIHAIPPREYYTQYQTALVLCGRGAAFRTPIHLSTTTAVVLQTCPYNEWYHSYMIPWEHYIPLDQDLLNLTATVEWIRDHPKELRGIAERGRQFYEGYLSFQRNYDHFYELLYRLSLLMSKKNITFEPPMR